MNKGQNVYDTDPNSVSVLAFTVCYLHSNIHLKLTNQRQFGSRCIYTSQLSIIIISGWFTIHESSLLTPNPVEGGIKRALSSPWISSESTCHSLPHHKPSQTMHDGPILSSHCARALRGENISWWRTHPPVWCWLSFLSPPAWPTVFPVNVEQTVLSLHWLFNVVLSLHSGHTHRGKEGKALMASTVCGQPAV